jgi:hypothetical protein
MKFALSFLFWTYFLDKSNVGWEGAFSLNSNNVSQLNSICDKSSKIIELFSYIVPILITLLFTVK